MKVVYLGVTGVLHPSATLFQMVHGRSPWNNGHSKYEGVPVLREALSGWPDAKLVLTAYEAWRGGLETVLAELGSTLAQRVIGTTYEDLTTKARVGPRRTTFSKDGYRRLTRSEVVRTHVEWLQPAAWVAIDDEGTFWTMDERRLHLVTTDPCRGLIEARALDRLMTLLVGNFGPPNAATTLTTRTERSLPP
jgi:HAD domain in Swiss Army Knife RNA repair proteins